jgi:hypothetical protein
MIHWYWFLLAAPILYAFGVLHQRVRESHRRSRLRRQVIVMRESLEAFLQGDTA